MSLVQATTRALTKGYAGPLPKYLNAEEIHQILEAVKDRKDLHLVINFLWKTGVRASEAVQVRMGDIDPYQKTLKVVTLKKSRRKTKGRKPIREHERVIPLADDLLAEILAWARELNLQRQDRLFPFSRQTLGQKVKKACQMAGIMDGRAKPHAFRHSFAVHLLRNGIPITVVQNLLGHTSIENTVVYLAILQSEAAQMLREVRW